MGSKLSYAYVKEYVESFGYKLISKEYVDALTKMNVRCPYGHIYPVNFGKFSTGRRCPYCQKKIRIKKEDFEEILNKEGYTLVGEFKNGNVRTDVICPEGHVWDINYQRFKKGTRCSKCSGRYIENRKKATAWKTDTVKEYIENEGFEFLSEKYVNNNTKIKVKCTKGHVNNIYFGHFLKGHRCRHCGYVTAKEKTLLSTEEVSLIFKQRGFNLIGEYMGCDKLVKVQCPNNHFFEVSLTNFRSGSGCCVCSSSKEEKLIMEQLDIKGIEYERELFVKHDNGVNNMYFDFVFRNAERDIVLIVEYDGKHHYVDYWGEEQFNNVQEWDARKNDYCIRHKIPLLRIPYTELKEASEIIEKYLKCKVLENKKCHIFEV